MTKEETIKIMAMLGAFYGGGKTNPKMQAEAWHLVLNKYDYHMAEQAVLHFAENDIRDYATFPAVGKIVDEIRKYKIKLEKPIKEIITSVWYGKDYKELSNGAALLIEESIYNSWCEMTPEEFAKNQKSYIEYLKVNRKLLGESNGKD